MPVSVSLSPRYDQFRILLDKTFLPEEVETKYQTLINKDSSIITTPIDYLNESIQGFEMPGISDLTVEQSQISHNQNDGQTRLGKRILGIEPAHENSYVNAANPLSQINRDLNITFRMNQGLYNYFMLYETIFWKIAKAPVTEFNDDIECYILNEKGEATSKITFYDCFITSLDGLEFSYSKVERQADTFDLHLSFNNIDFDYLLE